MHEIKHDGYRLLVRRDGERVRLWTRNAVDLTDRLPLIATAAASVEAQSFTIDGEAVALGPDGLSQFKELRSVSGTRRAMLYAFDLIELDGNDIREQSLLARKVALVNLLHGIEDRILLNEHIAADGALVFAAACKLGVEGIVSTTPPRLPCSGSGARIGTRAQPGADRRDRSQWEPLLSDRADRRGHPYRGRGSSRWDRRGFWWISPDCCWVAQIFRYQKGGNAESIRGGAAQGHFSVFSLEASRRSSAVHA